MASSAKSDIQPGLFEEPLRGEFVTDRLVRDLRQQIQSRVLKPGELILPVRDLCKHYQISYNSVRRALAQLAEEGLVSLEQGRGTFVKGGEKRPPRPPPRQTRAAAAPEGPADRAGGEPVAPGEGVLSAAPDPASSIQYPASRPSEPPPPAKDAAASAEDLLPETKVLARFNERVAAKPAAADEPSPAALAPTLVVRRRAVAVLGALPSGVFLGPAGFGPAVRAIEEQMLENGDAVTLQAAAPGKPLPGPAQLRAAGCCGVILLGVTDPEVLASFADSAAPCVLIGHWPKDLALSAVVPDNFTGAFDLTLRLLRAGHREVCFVRASGGGIVAGNTAERETACRVAWQEAGLVWRGSHAFDCPVEPSAAGWLADRILGLRPRPTAVFASHEPVARLLHAQLRERGVPVPQAMSLVTFVHEGGPAPCDFTAARVDVAQMGACAVGRLRQLLAGAPPERLRINLPVVVHEGATLAAP